MYLKYKTKNILLFNWNFSTKKHKQSLKNTVLPQYVLTQISENQVSDSLRFQFLKYTFIHYDLICLDIQDIIGLYNFSFSMQPWWLQHKWNLISKVQKDSFLSQQILWKQTRFSSRLHHKTKDIYYKNKVYFNFTSLI